MNWTALYFLSILDNLQLGFHAVYLFAIWISVILMGCWIVACGCNNRDVTVEDVGFVKRWVLPFFIAAMCFRLVSSVIPGKRDLVEAYAMIEGSKIITAQNGELVAKEVAGRFDKFLDIIAKRWGEPEVKPEAKPAETKAPN